MLPRMNSQTPETGTVEVPDLDWNAVRGLAYASCRNMPQWVPRDDLLQEASLAAWQAAGRWRQDGGSSLAGFVAQRAVGAVRDVMRKNAASTRDGTLRPVLVPLDEHRDPPAALSDTDVDLRVTFDQALDRLPPRHRHVVIEHFLNDRTIIDVGRDLGVTGAAVSLIGKSALRRLRQDENLREWIGLAS
jgi:RNA polymerase sigma factor (sigma-70 family)